LKRELNGDQENPEQAAAPVKETQEVAVENKRAE